MSQTEAWPPAIDPFEDMCPFCLGELRRGVPEDGNCRHEEFLKTYPHLRFNAHEHLDKQTIADSRWRFAEYMERRAKED